MKKRGLFILAGLALVLSFAYAQRNIVVPVPGQKIFRTSCSAAVTAPASQASPSSSRAAISASDSIFSVCSRRNEP